MMVMLVVLPMDVYDMAVCRVEIWCHFLKVGHARFYYWLFLLSISPIAEY